MPDVAGTLGRALNMRPGEGRTVVVMGGFLLLVTATTTVLSAATSGLFLSVYPGRYIPHLIIAAAVVSAGASILFSGIIEGTARRSLASLLTAAVVAALLASRAAYHLNPRWSLGVYLLLAAVQVVMVSHAWDYASDLLTGRQSRRLAPLLGVGGSVGTLMGGASVPFVVPLVGTENLLLVAAFFVAASLPLLWALPEPKVPVDETSDTGKRALSRFFAGAGRGLRGIGSEPLLAVMAAAAACLALTGALVELQFKTALQAALDKDQITAVLGIMSGVVGLGTLLAQLAASRWVFPRLGVSFAARLQAALLALAALGAAVAGGVWGLAALQAVQSTLQSSTQEPVEQVSLFPFPGPLKSASLATLGGVVRPLSEAGAGLLAILLAAHAGVLPALTVAAAGAGFVALTRHRRVYMDALVRALSRHTVELGGSVDAPLVVDREALAVIDRGLEDAEPTVVVFSVALLAQLPSGIAAPRVTARLRHPVPEVRAEAARVLSRLDLAPDERPVAEVRAAVDRETSRFALSSLLDTLGEWSQAEPEHLLPLARAGDPQVRRSALVALGHSGWAGTGDEIVRLLGAGAPWEDRVVGAGAVGSLGAVEHLDLVARAVEDPAARPAALEALSALGAPAVPVLSTLLGRRDLPLPVRRTLVTALAAVAHRDARAALVRLLDEPALGPAALTSLHRLRRERRMDPVDPGHLRPPLRSEVRRGLRCALASAAVRRSGGGSRQAFLAEELAGLAGRSHQRVLRLLALSHDPDRVASVQKALASGDAAQRSNALELLDGMLSPEEARLVMPYADAAAEGYAPSRVAELVGGPGGETRVHPLETLCGEDDWWVRSLALSGLGRDVQITIPGRDPGEDEEPDMIPIIERVMILKGSELFRYLPGQDLAGIATLAGVVHLEDGEVVFRQGDVGDALYMIVQGGVRIVRGSTELALLGPREGFGEMAVLDQETRSATAIAAEPTTLLRIERDAFDRLIEQNPSVARGIYRTLNQRLRNTLAQVAAG